MTKLRFSQRLIVYICCYLIRLFSGIVGIWRFQLVLLSKNCIDEGPTYLIDHWPIIILFISLWICSFDYRNFVYRRILMLCHNSCNKLVFYSCSKESMLVLEQSPSICSCDHIISYFNFLVFMETRVSSRKHALFVIVVCTEFTRPQWRTFRDRSFGGTRF